MSTQHDDTTMMPVDADNAASSNDAPGPAGPGQLMSSFFPSPPAYYKHYTSANLALARRLTSHADFTSKPDDWKSQQASILDLLDGVSQEEKERAADTDLGGLLEPPDVNVVEQDGHWNSFGQVWPIKEKLPGLEDMGVKQMYEVPKTFAGRRPCLLLRIL
jgi:mediator of RNA polymerase II transcription subunit 7